MTSWFCKFLILILGMLGVGIVSASSFKLDMPAGAKVEYSQKSDGSSHQLVLSTPKRISNSLRIERDKKVDGVRQNTLVQLVGESASTDAFRHYAKILEGKGKILYRCEQRACGSSNYWANTILGESKLYGRDSDQYYLAAKVEQSGKSYWVAIYTVKNGRKQHYAYVSIVESNGGNVGGSASGFLLDSPDLTDAQAKAIKLYLSNNPDHKLWVGAVLSPKEGASYSELIAQAENDLDDFKQRLIQRVGISSGQVESLKGFSSSAHDGTAMRYQLHLLAP